MATTTFTCNKDSRIATNSGSSLGAGTSDFNPIGYYSGYVYRTLLGFSYSFAGMVSITSAILHVRTSTRYYVGFGSDPDIACRRINAAWSEGSASSMSASNAVNWDNQPGTTGTTQSGDISTAESTWDTIDITTIMQEALAAGSFYGLQLKAPSESSSSEDVTEIYSREQGSSDPYITITYTDNQPPTVPTLGSPASGAVIAGVTPTLTFTHNDPDSDPMLNYDLQVSTDSAFASATHWNIASQTSGVSGSSGSRVYAGTALTRGTTYYWRVRTRSNGGDTAVSPWTGARSFKANRLPTVTFVTPSAVDANIEMNKVAGSGNPRMVVRWTFADPDGGSQKTYRVLVQTDALATFWDSGTITATTSWLIVPVDAARNTFYRVTVTVTDSAGESATTGARRCKSNWAVVEYRRDLGATVTKWAASIISAGGTNKLVVAEYASSSGGAAITTWYSSIGGAALGRWFHWRVWLFAWSGATTPSVTQMAMSYTTSAAVPPDGWTITSQHSLDAGTRVYGTQSLKVVGNGSVLNAYQKVYVEPYTDYIFSGRIKTDGASLALICLGTTGTGGTLVQTVGLAAATDEFVQVKTPVWNSGANSYVYVRCFVQAPAGVSSWFDALKLEASKVVTPWTPGFIGPALILDAGGVQVDAKAGGVLRLQGSSGGMRDTVELAQHGFLFGDTVEAYSPAAGELSINGINGGGNGIVRVYSGSAAAGSYAAFLANIAGDTAARLVVGRSGDVDRTGLFVGPGNAARDLNLYRYLAGRWRTDNDFDVVGELNSVGPTKGIKGFAVYQFSVAAVVGTGDVDMFPGPTNGSTQFRMPWAGSVVAIGVATNPARTAGTLMARAYSGSSSAIIPNSPFPTIDGTNTSQVYGTSAEGAATFAVGSLMRLRLTGAAFTPTTIAVAAYMVVKFE